MCKVFTSNPEHDADVYYLHQEIMGDQWDQMYQGNYGNPSNFETFIYDTDFSDPNWRIVHKALQSDDPVQKVQAMNAIDEMYSDYIEYITNEVWEDL